MRNIQIRFDMVVTQSAHNFFKFLQKIIPVHFTEHQKT